MSKYSPPCSGALGKSSAIGPTIHRRRWRLPGLTRTILVAPLVGHLYRQLAASLSILGSFKWPVSPVEPLAGRVGAFIPGQLTISSIPP